jgi:hypothetical protein
MMGSGFYDDQTITVEDRDHAEERFVTLGMDGFGRLLVVAYHYRGEVKYGLFPPAWPSLTSGAITRANT